MPSIGSRRAVRRGYRAGRTSVLVYVWPIEKSDALAAFRRFAHYSVFYGAGADDEGKRCAWFTDLRYWYDPLPAPFRFGACRTERDGPWRQR